MRINQVKSNNISFNGSIYSNKAMLNTLKFASDNAAVVAGGATFLLSTFVRPLAIMLTPKTDKKEKQYASAKSISSGVVSFALTTLAFNPIAKSVDLISKTPEKYLKQSTIDNLKIAGNSIDASKPFRTLKQAVKYSPSVITVIPKALLTTALITPIIENLFERKKETSSDKLSPQDVKQNNSVSFKGLSEHLTKDIAKFIDSPKAQKLAIKYQDVDNLFHHTMTLKDMFATTCFAVATCFNKKMDEKIKKPLILNSFISTTLTIIGGYAVNRLTEKPTEKFIDKLSQANSNDKNLSKYIDGVKVLKPILILGTIYYAVIPLVSTFCANKLAHKKEQ